MYVVGILSIVSLQKGNIKHVIWCEGMIIWYKIYAYAISFYSKAYTEICNLPQKGINTFHYRKALHPYNIGLFGTLKLQSK